jgi:lysophospholipase L1-like esterase
MRRRFALVVPSLIVAALAATACSDATAPDRARSLSPAADAELDRSEGRGIFQRYVAIGTSLSMGWQSDGAIAATQETSWPAQLAAMGHRTITQPYIDGTGCRSPLAAPLVSFRRISGESVGLPTSALSCSSLRGDVVKPVQNVAINAALTKDALFTTPENSTDDSNKQLISRVLQPGMTQVSTMVAENPKLVSVELGGNEVLNARNGVAIEGRSMFPYALWAPLYDAVLDQVQGVAKEAVIVGLIDDVASFPAFRRGSELYADALEFTAFNIVVGADCKDNQNLLFVPVIVPTAVATGAAYAQNHIGPYTLHCTASPDATVEDYTLTPSEAATVNDLLARMNAHIREQAQLRHFAYFALQSLYGRADIKGPFSVVTMMTTDHPYGSLISLDGVHPTAAGAQVLAQAAAQALDDRYDHHILGGERHHLIASR